MSEVINVEYRSQLSDLLATNDRVVVKFTAPSWCVPCQRFAPVYKAVAAQTDDTIFVSVDVDNAPWATEEYGVRGVPTVKLFEGGSWVRDLTERTAIRFINELS